MKKRIDSLNFIRIIGMTMILLFHAKLIYGFSVGLPWLDNMISIGAIFVTVFFMLSGFGLRKSNRDLALGDRAGLLRYYKKRIMSIYPLFLLLTVVALIFQFRMMEHWQDTLLRLPIQFSMLHILFGKDMHGFLFNDNCWYISALFVLYLLFPFLNEVVNRLHVRMKVFLCVVLWIVTVGVYFYCVYFTKLTFLDYYPNPFLRIPEFMIGMMVADMSEELTWKKSNGFYGVIVGLIVVIASVGLTLLRPYFIFETNLYGIIVIPCTVAIFLCFSNWDWLNQVGRLAFVHWFAGLGLEVYLCQSFATLVIDLVKIGGEVDEIVFIGLSMVFAILVNTFFTKKIMRMARK